MSTNIQNFPGDVQIRGTTFIKANSNTNNIAIGTNAGETIQGVNTVAVGVGAGMTTQGTLAVAVGPYAGLTSQGASAVAVGHDAGQYNQGTNAVAVGLNAGETSQGDYATAVGREAGRTSQGAYAVAVGVGAGTTSQGSNAVAVGVNAGNTSQGASAVAVGIQAGQTSQGTNATAVGRQAGETSQGTHAVAIGYDSGSTGQGTYATAVGVGAGKTSQGASTVAVGQDAGSTSQGTYAVAVGYLAGQTSQGTNATAVGRLAGQTSQGASAVAVGYVAGRFNQGAYATAVGWAAGESAQGSYATAVGREAGLTSQGSYAVAVGRQAGSTGQGLYAVAVGYEAGRCNQGIDCTAVGRAAGESAQGSASVAIGPAAGTDDQGTNCVAIGREAGRFNQHNNTIVLNAAGAQFNTGAIDRFYVKKIRLNSGSLSWATSTGEVYANTSDDRIKHNETYIKNALRTIMKLKPQTYDKAPDLESNTYIEMRESGLMVQDIWYDVPEMRHIVRLSQTANPTPEKPPAPSDDPADDPDYSAWGIAPSSLEYDQVVPFLAKAVQEVAVEVPRAKTTVSNTWGQNITGLVVSADTNKHKTNTVPLVSLSTISMDKSWYGVVSDEKIDSTDYDTLVDIKGDTRVWVTDLSGSLESGDFITTSNISPGYTQKQSDDFVHNYTIGKITQDCDFTEPPSITIKVPRQELSNVTYYIHQEKMGIGEEEYNTIGMECNKTAEIVTAYRKNQEDEGITQERYDTLDPSEQEEYTAYQKTNYYRLDRYETKFQNRVTNKMHTIEEIRQELVDVLDENGQTVWEDTSNTVPVYTLVDHGTYKAALVTCKLI